jgi:hypothetical protein
MSTLSNTAIPKLKALITGLGTQIRSAGVHSTFVPRVMQVSDQARTMVKSLCRSIEGIVPEGDHITDTELSSVAGLGNLLRAAAQRLMVKDRLKTLVYRAERFNDDLKIKSLGNREAAGAIGLEARTNVLLEVKWRCGADSILIDRDCLMNENKLWVRGVADSSIRKTADIFQGDSFLSSLFPCGDYASPVTVNANFNSQDLPGLKNLIEVLKSKYLATVRSDSYVLS